MTSADSSVRYAFVSYRRADAGAVAGRLTDRLRRAVPNMFLFLDVDSIVPGDNWRVSIDRALDQAAILLVIIGARWRGENEDKLADKDDMVRYEIAVALRKNIRIIPILVDGTRMPRAGDLPQDIVEFATKNAIEIRHSRFDDDAQNLVRAISREHRHTISIPWRNQPRTMIAALRGALYGFVIILVGLILCKSITGHAMSEHIGSDGASLILALAPVIGAAVECRRNARRTER